MQIFPIEIYTAKYYKDMNFVYSTLQPYLDEYNTIFNNNQGSMRGSGVCSYVERRDLHLDPAFSDVVDFLKEQCIAYWSLLKYNPKYKPIIKEMWFNVYNNESFIDIHNHAPMTTTCSLYVQKLPNVGNIVFENPLSTLLKHQPYYIDKDNYHTLFETEVEAQTGDLVMFPGWLNHKTLPNTSDKERIMIGANICTGV